jgi:hypothetical protein
MTESSKAAKVINMMKEWPHKIASSYAIVRALVETGESYTAASLYSAMSLAVNGISIAGLDAHIFGEDLGKLRDFEEFVGDDMDIFIKNVESNMKNNTYKPDSVGFKIMTIIQNGGEELSVKCDVSEEGDKWILSLTRQ